MSDLVFRRRATWFAAAAAFALAGAAALTGLSEAQEKTDMTLAKDAAAPSLPKAPPIDAAVPAKFQIATFAMG